MTMAENVLNINRYSQIYNVRFYANEKQDTYQGYSNNTGPYEIGKDKPNTVHATDEGHSQHVQDQS